MKSIKTVISIFIALLLCVSVFSGCSGKSDRVDFIYPFDADVRSFDPQVASTADEFLIVENCFEGLIRMNDDGSIQAGVAREWSISDDGLTYTFKLRQDAKWNIDVTDKDSNDSRVELVGQGFSNNVTANDFVFALRRAVDKNTDCPLFSSVSNIVNANEIHSGKTKPEKLGVKALDDYTLEIKLKSPDKAFMRVLTTAVAMPCNEAFFNATKGRYGLGLKYSVFNGQFYLSSILESSYILKNNSLYTGDYPSVVTDITLRIKNESSEIAKNLKSGYYDAAYISGSEYEQLKDGNITAIDYTDKTLALVLNKNNIFFTDKNMRQAMLLSVSNIDLSNIEHLAPAKCFTPPSCYIGNDPATDKIGQLVPNQNIEKSKELWRKGLEKFGASKAEFTVITTKEYEPYAKQLVQGIQAGVGQVSSFGESERSFAFTLKISVLSQEDYTVALAKNEYDIAFCAFQAKSNNPLNFLDSVINSTLTGSVPEAEEALTRAQSKKASELSAAVTECEKALMKDYCVLPVMFESSYYAQAKGVSGVQFHPGSGRVCFVNASRED